MATAEYVAGYVAEYVQYAVACGATTLILNRPQRRNALTFDIDAALHERCRAPAGDTTVVARALLAAAREGTKPGANMTIQPGSSMDFLHPPGWPRARGYSHGVAASGRTLHVSGMVGWDAAGQFHSDDFVAQSRQALVNIAAVLREGGAGPEHLVRLTWYVVDRVEYLAASTALGVAYRAVIGRHYPAMSVVQVAALMDPRARVEIEATAIVPELGARD